MCRKKGKQREGKTGEKGERDIKERGAFKTLWLKDVI